MGDKPYNPAIRIVRSSARTLLQGAVELLLFFPVVLWCYLYISPVLFVPWVISLAACYPLGNLIAALIRVRNAALFYAILLFFAALFTWLLFGGAISLKLIVAWVLIAALLYRGALMRIKDWVALFPNHAFIIGLISYFIASIVSSVILSWRPYAPAILWLGLISLALTLFMTNRLHLDRSAPSGFSVSPTVSSRNWIWLSVLFVVILGVSLFSVIGRLLGWVIGFIAYIVGMVASWLIGKVQSDGIRPDPVQMPELPEQVKHEETFWDWLLQYGTRVLLYLIVAVAAVAIGYVCYKWAKFLIRKMLKSQNKMFKGMGFIDEKKRLLDLPERSKWGSRLRMRLGSMLKRQPRWEQMTDWRSQLRWLYRRRLADAVKRGYELQVHLTPQETMRDVRVWEKKTGHAHDNRLEKHYEQARYGSGENPVSEAEIAELYKKIQTK